jgi:hypothetical protein
VLAASGSHPGPYRTRAAAGIQSDCPRRGSWHRKLGALPCGLGAILPSAHLKLAEWVPPVGGAPSSRTSLHQCTQLKSKKPQKVQKKHRKHFFGLAFVYGLSPSLPCRPFPGAQRVRALMCGHCGVDVSMGRRGCPPLAMSPRALAALKKLNCRLPVSFAHKTPGSQHAELAWGVCLLGESRRMALCSRSRPWVAPSLNHLSRPQDRAKKGGNVFGRSRGNLFGARAWK